MYHLLALNYNAGHFLGSKTSPRIYKVRGSRLYYVAPTKKEYRTPFDVFPLKGETLAIVDLDGDYFILVPIIEKEAIYA